MPAEVCILRTWAPLPTLSGSAMMIFSFDQDSIAAFLPSTVISASLFDSPKNQPFTSIFLLLLSVWAQDAIIGASGLSSVDPVPYDDSLTNPPVAQQSSRWSIT